MKKKKLFSTIILSTVISLTAIFSVVIPKVVGANADMEDQKIKFHFLNVNSIESSAGGPIGSADCIIIEDNVGESRIITMVDTGHTDSASCNKVVSYCKELNIERIDNLFLTHPHSDHVGGVPAICDNFDVTRCYYTLPQDWTKVRPQELDWSTKNNADIALQALKEKINSNGKGVEIISPDKEGKYYAITENSGFTVYNCLAVVKNNYREPEFNDFSMCMKYSFGNVNALFTGDINPWYEYVFIGEVNEQGGRVTAGSPNAVLPVGEIQIFKLPHHGTDKSTDELFNIMNPNKKDGIAVVTGYKDNIGSGVLELCEQYGYETKVTHDGDVVIWTDGAYFGYVTD